MIQHGTSLKCHAHNSRVTVMFCFLSIQTHDETTDTLETVIASTSIKYNVCSELRLQPDEPEFSSGGGNSKDVQECAQAATLPSLPKAVTEVVGPAGSTTLLRGCWCALCMRLFSRWANNIMHACYHIDKLY